MLIVLASFLIPISVISTWAITTVTKTDKYVATMAPLARNPVIVDHLATKATDVLFSSHIVQDKVTAALFRPRWQAAHTTAMAAVARTPDGSDAVGLTGQGVSSA